MSTHRQLRRWSDSDTVLPATLSPLAVQTTFRHMPSSPAATKRVEAEVQKLHRYFQAISHCHVVIAAPHHHHRLGRTFSVHVELSVPGERLTVTHEHAGRPHPKDNGAPRKRADEDATHADLYVVLREVFDATRRRLEDYARRQRGDVKRHRARAADSLAVAT
jgi:hypothetical protein